MLKSTKFINKVNKVSSTEPNLFPIYDRAVRRTDKEAKLYQRARVVWFFGLSGAGKSTLAMDLERTLMTKGYTTHLLDGDNVRSGLNRGLGFSDADRSENLRRVAEVAKLFLDAGIVTLCSFITPLRAHRELVRAIVGPADFVPIYVHASFATCARRDPKGLYARAAAGEVLKFSGRDSMFEEPDEKETAFRVLTETESLEDCSRSLVSFVESRIRVESSL